MVHYENKVAQATKYGTTNDKEYSEEMIDILSEECTRIFRPLIRDDGLRTRVLADAFAKEQVRCHRGDVFSCLREGEEIASDRVSLRLVERYPYLYGNVEIDDSDDDLDYDDDHSDDQSGHTHSDVSDQDESGFEDPFDEFCESEFCDGCCEGCPIACVCIPIFILDGTEPKVVFLERDHDA